MMTTIQGSDVRKVVVACEAGMGSSVLLVSQLQKRLAAAGVQVDHAPVTQIPSDVDLIMCHRGMLDTARERAPDKVVVPFDMFLGDPAFDRVVNAITKGGAIEG
jgi:mannitol-specific phosphotransferase system IIBC component